MKQKNSFLLRKYEQFFKFPQGRFFLFFEFGLKSAPDSPAIYYLQANALRWIVQTVSSININPIIRKIKK